jgi:hypothetical protein
VPSLAKIVPLEKGNPLLPKRICAKSGEEVKNIKVYRWTTGDQNSSLELSAKVSEKLKF